MRNYVRQKKKEFYHLIRFPEFRWGLLWAAVMIVSLIVAINTSGFTEEYYSSHRPMKMLFSFSFVFYFGSTVRVIEYGLKVQKIDD